MLCWSQIWFLRKWIIAVIFIIHRKKKSRNNCLCIASIEDLLTVQKKREIQKNVLNRVIYNLFLMEFINQIFFSFLSFYRYFDSFLLCIHMCIFITINQKRDHFGMSHDIEMWSSKSKLWHVEWIYVEKLMSADE